VADPELIPACRTIMNEFYGNELPATSYILQPPSQGKLLAIEAIGVGRGKTEVQIERFSDQFVRVTHNALSWVADVCRPELLVEIEGMAFSRRK